MSVTPGMIPPGPSPESLPPELLALLLAAADAQGGGPMGGGGAPPALAGVAGPLPPGAMPFPPVGPAPPMSGPLPPTPLGVMPQGPAGVPPPPPPTPDLLQTLGLGPNGQPPLPQAVSLPSDQEDMEGAPTALSKPKKPKRKKPDDAKIQQLCDDAVNYWQARDARMDEDQALYDGDDPSLVGTGEGETIIRNIPFVVVEKAANLLAAQEPVIQVIPPHNREKDVAQKAEDFLRWSWKSWNRTHRRAKFGQSIERAMAHFGCLRGWIALRMVYNPEAEEFENPLQLTPYDPRQVYPMFGNDDLSYVVHRYYLNYAELRAEFEEAAKLFPDEDDVNQVEVTAYYDDWYHGVYVDGQPVKKLTEHGYGFVPWAINTAGGSPIRATTTNSDSWRATYGVSIFHGIRGAYRQMNKVLSQIATEVSRSANPPLIHYYDPITGKPERLSLEAGSVNYLMIDRERVDPIDLTPKPQNVMPLMNALQEDIDRGSLPSIMWGAPGAGSGFTSSILTDSARDALFAVVECQQDVMTFANEMALRLVRDIHDGPIGYWTTNDRGELESGVTITPEDVEQVGVENIVRFRDIAPKDRAMMAQLAAMLTDKKLISLREARETYLGIDNPERMNEEVLTDLIYMDEKVVKEVLVPRALMLADPEGLYPLWQTAQSKQQAQPGPGNQPGSGAPSLPPGVLPPVAQPGADLMAQSAGSVAGGFGAQAPPGVPGLGVAPPGPPLF